jgi:hypothetical protein
MYTHTHSLRCPECGGSKIYKDGLHYLAISETVQRWLCRVCGRRFSQPNVKVNIVSEVNETLNPGSDLAKSAVREANLSVKEVSQGSAFSIGKDVGSHNATIIGKESNNLCSYNSSRKYALKNKGAKNLNEALETKTSAEEQSHIDQTQQGLIVEFQWKIKRRNKTDATIQSRTSWLLKLVKLGANLMNPESIETILATEEMTTAPEHNIVKTHAAFARAYGVTWEPIKVRYEPKEIFVSLQEEVDLLITSCSKVAATFLQVCKDTGARISEVRKI